MTISGSPSADHRGRRLAVLVAAGLAAGCVGGGNGGTSTPGMADPCPEVEPVDLGAPVRGGPTATFTLGTDTQLWLSATGFAHGGALDPDIWRARVDIGHADREPSYDEQRSAVDGSDVTVEVIEERWVSADVEGGEHWLWTTAGGSVLIKSCDGDTITEAGPVRR